MSYSATKMTIHYCFEKTNMHIPQDHTTAQKVFIIPATSVASESDLSTARVIVFHNTNGF